MKTHSITFFTFLFSFLLIIQAHAQSSTQTSPTQTIKGRLLDEASKTPIIGAVVVLAMSDPIKGTQTDEDGYFKLEQVPVGRQTLKISYVGYEPLILPDFMVTAGKEVMVNLTLTESVAALKEVTVSYDRKNDPTVTNNEMATVSARSFNPDETKKYAGSLGDPSRMAANFAGVVAGNDSRNDIVVRGNSPNAMLWQLEGLNIPNPNHFGSNFSTGGPVSILNANNIAKSDFFTSAFPAQYGNANGGVFDLRLREGNYDKKEFLGQIGFNGFEVGAEGPFSKKSKASFIFNYRYSTLGLLKNVGVSAGTGASTPLYQDLNFKIVVPTKGNGRFTFFGMGGFSAIDLLGKDVDTTKANYYGTVDENTIPRYRTGVTGISFEKNLSSRTWAKLTLGASQIHSDYYVDSIDIKTQNTYRTGDGYFTDNKYSAVFQISHKLNAKNTLGAGLTNDFSDINYFNRDVFGQGTRDTIRVNEHGNMNLSQGYVQLKHRFNERLTLNLGLHSQYASVNQKAVIEPRVGLRYSLTDKASLNAGYGLHHQLLPIYNLLVKNRLGEESNKNLNYTRSNHIVLGYENNLKPTLKLKVETYYQFIDQVPVSLTHPSFSTMNIGASFIPNDEANLVNTGTGTNYGAELTLERYFNKGYYFLITGSVFDSKYKGSDGIERNTAFNSHYAGNLLGGKEFKVGKKGSVLYTSIKMTSVGGKYFTPVDIQASQASGTVKFIDSEAFSQKQTAYFRMDLKIGYRRDYKASSLDFAVDFQNVTNNQNIFQQGYNKYKNVITNNYQQGFFPVPMVRYTF